MLAIGIKKFGDLSVIEQFERPVPKPGPDQILVKVQIAGVGPWDILTRNGAFGQTQFPIMLGFEAAGAVEAVGENVKDFKFGEEVLGVNYSDGCFAEYVLFNASQAIQKNTGLDWTIAGALPVCGATAWNAVRKHLNVQEGESLLVTGAAGNVGSLAVQVASELRAHVVTMANPKEAVYLRGLGAEMVADYTTDWVAKIKSIYPRGVLKVLDTVGGDTLQKCFDATKDGGQVLSIVPRSDKPEPPRGITYSFYQDMPDRNVLKEVARRATYGSLRLRIDNRYPLYRAKTALERIEQRQAKGKIILFPELRTMIQPPK